VHRRGSVEFSPPLNEAIVNYFSAEFHGFLSSMGSIGALVYNAYFKDPKPARTTVVVSKLVGAGHLEITATARK
jgi:hypothetical protein